MAEGAMTSLNELSTTDVARLRRRLLDMRAELEARRSDRDVLQLKRVESALNKMARGGYGNCESCARPLLKTRVLETPHVRYCAVCSGGRISVPPRGAAAPASFVRPHAGRSGSAAGQAAENQHRDEAPGEGERAARVASAFQVGDDLLGADE